jgi:hypothetical protein
VERGTLADTRESGKIIVCRLYGERRKQAYYFHGPFIVLTGNNVHLESATFVQWILSPAGQAVVTDKGYISPR